MSVTDLNLIFLEWLERKGHDKAARAFRREAGLPGGRALPIAKMEAFQEHVTKEVSQKLVKFRNDNYKEAYNTEKNEKKRQQIQDDYDGDDDNNQDSGIKKQRVNHNYPPPKEHEPFVGKTNRCFLGNLNFKITEAKIKSFFADCGEVTDVQWVTDKTTGNFYGTAFVEFETQKAAELATSKNGKKCLERPIVVKLQGHRAEPTKDTSGIEKKKMPPAPKISDRPEGCTTLFMGNLSFEVTEEQVRSFFGECGSIYEVRWGARPDGSFNGIGWIQFDDESAMQKAVKLHGKALASRPVRLDYA